MRKIKLSFLPLFLLSNGNGLFLHFCLKQARILLFYYSVVYVFFFLKAAKLKIHCKRPFVHSTYERVEPHAGSGESTHLLE